MNRDELRSPVAGPTEIAPSEATPGLPDNVGIVHLVAEYWPYARSGGLAEAARGIAIHQAASGSPTTVIMPLYRSIRESGIELTPFSNPFDVPLGPTREPARLLRTTDHADGVQMLFVEHDGFFGRDGLYGDASGDYGDNHRRFALFARAALHVLPQLGSERYVVHAHDWHAALAPVYLRTVDWEDPVYAQTAVVLSVHNAGYQGHFSPDVLREIGLPPSMNRWDTMEWFGRINLLKGGLNAADYVTTVSPTHAYELRTPVGGFGLHDQFIALADRLVGIRNGIDLSIWDPQTDPQIVARYGPDDMSGKAVCKDALQEALGIPREPSMPLIAMTARLARQKGFDILLGDGLLYRLPVQFVFLGEGDPGYARALSQIARDVPDRVAVCLEFTEAREHDLLAGADFLLMPSMYEPCGLTQMRAQRYGALPIVRRTGGLADTVDDQVTGFVFDDFTTADLERAIRRAIAAYETPDWPGYQREAMGRDFGWQSSADRYQAVYRKALQRASRASAARA